jgi:hypothetical protein
MICTHHEILYLVIKSRRIRWAGHVARVVDARGAYKILVGDLKEGDHLEDPVVDGRIILKWIFRTWDGGIDWIDMAEDRGQVACCCECGN